jgi:hypothetical protein
MEFALKCGAFLASFLLQEKRKEDMAERGFVAFAVNWSNLSNALGSDDEQLFKQVCEDHEDHFDEHARTFSKPEEKVVPLSEALHALIMKNKAKNAQHPWVYIHALRLLCDAFGEVHLALSGYCVYSLSCNCKFSNCQTTR